MTTKLWLVGRTRNRPPGVWEFQGIFSTEEQALEAAWMEGDFIGPCTLDKRLPEETTDTWPGCYFPNGEAWPR